ncbi:MAG: hypothetical protein ACOC46_01195 [Pirellulales bacterium]
MRTLHNTLTIITLALLLGCGGEDAPNGTSDGDVPATPETSADVPPPPPPAAAPAQKASDHAAEAASAGEGGAAAKSKPAGVGVGKKGRGYSVGPIATPLKARWTAAERLVFDVQIPKAMKLYRAANGHPPRSHDEFITEIIEKNRINLPELPEGEQYRYNAGKAQLMVTERSE